MLTNINLPSISCSIIDGGLILYEVLIQHTTSSYVNIATELLAGLCTLQGMEIHLLLDKYKSQSTCIKDNERKLRCRTQEVFIITGPQQIQKTTLCQIGKKNCSFIEEFSKFVLIEWNKSKYRSIIEDKKIYVSHGGKCVLFQLDACDQTEVFNPETFQAQHEEADTLIGYHTSKLMNHTIFSQSSNTDVLVIF